MLDPIGVSAWLFMRELVGHKFAIADVLFLIVDVQNVAGAVMVYAEDQAKRQGPKRAAFRYDDIADLIDVDKIA